MLSIASLLFLDLEEPPAEESTEEPQSNYDIPELTNGEGQSRVLKI